MTSGEGGVTDAIKRGLRRRSAAKAEDRVVRNFLKGFAATAPTLCRRFADVSASRLLDRNVAFDGVG
jgi:hypothetical protein